MTGPGSSRSEVRQWKVVTDPSNLFTGNLFRLIDLKAGGFDPGTVFEHIRSGERRMADGNGIARKCKRNVKLSSPRRSKRPALLQTKAAPGLVRAAGNLNRRLPA